MIDFVKDTLHVDLKTSSKSTKFPGVIQYFLKHTISGDSSVTQILKFCITAGRRDNLSWMNLLYIFVRNLAVMANYTPSLFT